MDKFIAVGETKVHYIEQGQGKPMILLHGSHYSADTWKTIGLIDALSPLVRVIAIDLPGFGASEPLKYADWPDYVYFLERFSRAMKLDKFILLGSSMGGGIALEYTLKHLNSIFGLILVGAVRIPEHLAELKNLAGIPILLIWGANDTIVPVDNAYLIINSVDSAKIEFIGSRHACYLDDPGNFNRVVKEFVVNLLKNHV